MPNNDSVVFKTKNPASFLRLQDFLLSFLLEKAQKNNRLSPDKT